RYAARLGPVTVCAAEGLEAWMAEHALDQVVTAYLPVGPTADALGKVPLVRVIRPYDAAAWPHATHGFFRFKEKIPALIGQLNGLRVA
ncbi:MAG: DNA photolyase, partial [Paracoccaceae bacterium]|nr:DNA photolyase [Paracoccaceae bacterium]